MTGDRLRALALAELRSLASQTADSLVSQLLRLEADARSLFLLQEHSAGEVRSVLSRFVQVWRTLLDSDELLTSFAGAQASESMMEIWDLAMGGLWTAAALDDRESISEGYRRLFSDETPQTELAQACGVLARQIYLLSEGHRAQAASLQRDSWHDWVELEWVHADDPTWAALRGIAASDERAVQVSLGELSRKRTIALDHAIDSGSMLRQIPARLVLETEAAALVRLARRAWMDALAEPRAMLTRRAQELWRFE